MAPLPSGFHFTPTKEEILNKLLTKKAKGQPFHTRLVVEKSVFDNQSEPWDVFTRNDPWLPDGGGEFSMKHVLHVYTKVSCVSKETNDGRRGKNIKRKSGRGSWMGQNTRDVYSRNQELIGQCKNFTYEPEQKWVDMDTMRKDYGSWTMHEYSLKGINGTSDYVFCKIMLNLNSKDGSVPGLLNEGIKVIEQEDTVALNIPPQAPTSVFPSLPPITTDQGRGNIYVNPATNIISNNGWTPESTYGYNEAASEDYPNVPPAVAYQSYTNYQSKAPTSAVFPFLPPMMWLQRGCF